jgi:hypothetical protein
VELIPYQGFLMGLLDYGAGTNTSLWCFTSPNTNDHFHNSIKSQLKSFHSMKKRFGEGG